MPIRIKPVHELRPCLLNLTSIEGLSALVKKEFPSATFSATDTIWEIYDEPSRDEFLKAISSREKLDTFIIKTPPASIVSASQSHPKDLELRFTESEAKILFNGNPDDENWFEHFLIDAKKYILSPTFRQLLVYLSTKNQLYLKLPLLIIPMDIEISAATPYSKIVIHQKAPNPFWENIKANIVSNIIWAILTFALGVIATIIAQQYLNK